MEWKSRVEKERNKPKFLKTGTKVKIDFSFEPIEEQVDGKYGKRPMFIIETVEYGTVYVNAKQLMHIADVAKNDFADKMTVEL